MRRIVLSTCIAVAFAVVAVDVARATMPRAPVHPASFPRVVREDFVSRLAAKVSPLVALEPLADYRPACCFEATSESMCRVLIGNSRGLFARAGQHNVRS